MKTPPRFVRLSIINLAWRVAVCAVPLLIAWENVHSQGTVNFNNFVNAATRAPIFAPQLAEPGLLVRGQSAQRNSMPQGPQVYTGAPLSGPGYSAVLYAGPEGTTNEADLIWQTDSTTFRDLSFVGYVVGLSWAAVYGTSPDMRATFQFRAWDNKGGTITTWEQAVLDPSVARGSSYLFTPAGVLGGFHPGGSPPPTQALQLSDLQSFCLYLPNGPTGITGQPNSAIVPPGGSTNFTVAVGTPSRTTLQWRFNGSDIPGATNTVLPMVNAQYSDAGDYTAVVVDMSLTQTSRVAKLVVQPNIVAIDQAPIEPWGVKAIRISYDSSPNQPVYLEMHTSDPGSSWQTLGNSTLPFIRGLFYDVYSTNQSRIYRLRLN